MEKPRTLTELCHLFQSRYDIGEELLEPFLNHESIHWLENVELNDDNSDLKEIADSINLERYRFGAYAEFLSVCDDAGLDSSKVFKHFADSSEYWGPTGADTMSEIAERLEELPNYDSDGGEMLDSIHQKNKIIEFKANNQTYIPWEILEDAPTSGPFDDHADWILSAFDVQCNEKELIDYLLTFGAWNNEELQDHDTNLGRLVWNAVLDCVENNTQYYYMGS